MRSASDSLAAFRIGPLAPGQTASTEVNFLVSNATGEMWFSGFIVQDLQRLPLPGSLPLVAIAAVALWTAGGGSPFWVGVYLSGAGVLTLIALLVSKETKDIDIER